MVPYCSRRLWLSMWWRRTCAQTAPEQLQTQTPGLLLCRYELLLMGYSVTSTRRHLHLYGHPGCLSSTWLWVLACTCACTQNLPTSHAVFHHKMPLLYSSHPCQVIVIVVAWLLQVRQHTEHKRTFMFLEQVILKYSAAANCINIKDIHEVNCKPSLCCLSCFVSSLYAGLHLRTTGQS